jgi:RNA polymerase sigma factor (sigma-70 family)
LKRAQQVLSGLEAATLTDRQLLARFVAHQDADAFAAIVQRHGGMVWGVCRRVLGDANDADDAFQAVFLVLLTKAEALHARESLASWLQGVAWRLARRARVDAVRRKAKEERVPARTSSYPSSDLHRGDVRQVLDEELDRLPEKYRAPLTLCYLEGKTYAEAARQLGWADGTVCGRLARARELLRRRLTRRGFVISVATLTTTSLEPATAPAATTSAVLRMASLFVLGQAARGTVPIAVLALSRGLLRTWILSHLKLAVVIASIGFVVAFGAGWTARHRLGDPPVEQAVRLSAPPAGQLDRKQEHLVNQQTLKDFYGDPLPPGAIARMGSIQFRHANANFAFSNDGRSLISVKENSLFCWDVASGALVRRSQIPNGLKVNNYPSAISRDGKTVVMQDEYGIHVYDTSTMEALHHYPAASAFVGALSGNGSVLAALESRDTAKGVMLAVQMWDLATGKKGAFIDKVNGPGCELSQDGTLLATLDGGLVHIWETQSGTMLGTIRLGTLSWALSADGKTVASPEEHSDGTVMLWDTATCKTVATLKPVTALESDVRQPISFSPDGAYLAVGSIDKAIIYDVHARKELARLPGLKGARVLFAPDNKTVACIGTSMVRLWDLTTKKELLHRAGYDGGTSSLSVSPDGSLLASVDSFKAAADLWNTANGQPLSPTPWQKFWVHRSLFAPDGKLLIWGSGGRQALLEPRNGKTLREFHITDIVTGKPAEEIYRAHFSKDGKRLTSLSRSWTEDGRGSRRHQLTMWDVATGKELVRRPLAGESLTAGFSPDALSVLVVENGRLRIEETLTGREWLNVPTDVGEPCALSPVGHVAAFGIRPKDWKDAQVPGSFNSKGMCVIELATGERICSLDCVALHVGFSSDGKVVVTAGDGVLEVWDSVTGEKLFHLNCPDELVSKNPGATITALAVMPDGRAAVTAMQNGTMLVWDLTPAKKPANWSRAQKLEQHELEALWSDLTQDAKIAQPSVHMLAAAPEQAVPFLAERLRPVAAIDTQALAKTIRDLDSQEFAVRELASRTLARAGEPIAPALRQALESKPAPDTRRRMEAILAGLHGAPTGESRRTIRAIQVLSMVGTPAARRVLERIASGDPDARETKYAKQMIAGIN